MPQGLTFRKAERKKAKLRLALFGPAGSGKTYSALRVAKGLGGRVALIDTEAGSGELYSAQFDYDVCPLSPPFTPEKYVEAMRAAADAGYATVIIDSLSHAWAGVGGILDIQGKAADKVKNSYTAWRDVTPRHNELVDALLQAPLHVIATMRSKTEYVLETNEKGKQVPRKVGLAPVQRDGFEYEFTCCAEVDETHEARFSKDRTSLFSGKDWSQLTEATGAKLLAWLESGADNGAATPEGARPAKKAAATPLEVPEGDVSRDDLVAWLWHVARSIDGVETQDGFKPWLAKACAEAGVIFEEMKGVEGRRKLRDSVAARLRPAEPAPVAPTGVVPGSAIGTTPKDDFPY